MSDYDNVLLLDFIMTSENTNLQHFTDFFGSKEFNP